MINASGSDEGSAKGDDEEPEERQAIEGGIPVNKPARKLRKKKAKKDGKGLKPSTTELKPKIDAKSKQGGKGYVDIYSGLNEGGDKKMNVVTEALYNQYKERSRKFIQQQQQKAKTMASQQIIK